MGNSKSKNDLNAFDHEQRERTINARRELFRQYKTDMHNEILCQLKDGYNKGLNNMWLRIGFLPKLPDELTHFPEYANVNLEYFVDEVLERLKEDGLEFTKCSNDSTMSNGPLEIRFSNCAPKTIN